MEALTSYRDRMADFLREQLWGQEVTVTTEFPGVLRQVPPQNAILAVGFSNVEQAGRGGQVKLELRLEILCAPGKNPGCHALFDRLCALLVCGETSFGVSGLRCGEIRYDRDLEGLRLTAQATVTGLLSDDETALDGEPFTNIEIHTKGV